MIESVKNFDEKALVFIARLGCPWLDKFMVGITMLGNTAFIWLLTSFFLMLKRELRPIGVKVFLAVLLTGFIGEIIIKRRVCRSRPSSFVLQEDLSIKKPITYSFPSGHTSSSFAAASMLAGYFHSFIMPAFVLAGLIALSRLYLKVHYPTDIAAGAILGFCCTFLVNYILRF